MNTKQTLLSVIGGGLIGCVGGWIDIHIIITITLCLLWGFVAAIIGAD